MAEKEDYSQSELFSSADNGGQYKPRRRKNPFFLRMRGYEKVMILIMGLVLTGIISFSWGVEKGRRMSGVKNNTPEQAGFTIQVATFKSKTNAQKEAQLLQKKGYQALVFTKNSQMQLCVGQFLTKEEAQPYVMELKKKYEDCFIRRL